MKKYGISRNPHGRPRGTGRFGEPTRTVRVPISMADEVVAYAEAKGYRLPLYENKVSAGTLTPTDADVVETFDIVRGLVRHPADTFCVRVQGESMIGAGIMPDDVLVVDRKEVVREGKIVVAAVNGDVTVKRFSQTGGKVRLLPENPAFQPIVVGELDELHIWGCVRGVVRQYA